MDTGRSPRVFVSSVLKEFPQERSILADALASRGFDVILLERLEDFPGQGRYFSPDIVAECDAFVGLYGATYGQIPTGQKTSWIELEFDAAAASQKPILAFIDANIDSLDVDPRLESLLGRVSQRAIRAVRVPFDEPAILVQGVLDAFGPLFAPSDPIDPGTESESPGARADSQEGRIDIAARLLADGLANEDLLGFRYYADAIAEFIRSPQTDKPLTIGIDAPWGMGKSSLMAMVRRRLETECERPGRPSWFREPRQLLKQDRRGATCFPTVWFNAWKYDQEESLWAALALEIITNVQRSMTPWQRARLWGAVNVRRVNTVGLLLGIARVMLLTLLVLVICVVLATSLLALTGNRTLSSSVAWLSDRGKDFLVLGGVVGGVVAATWNGIRQVAQSLEFKVSDYVRDPDYRGHIGFLSQFEQDFQQIVAIATDDGKWPLIVFIDDLDRCSPPQTVEVIEAINLLLDSKHCVFVLAMDMDAVARSIEARYKDQLEFFAEQTDANGQSFGRRFIEKIVQIDIRIPNIDPKLAASFVDRTLGGQEVSLAAPANEQVQRAEALIQAERRGGKELDEAVESLLQNERDLPIEVVKEAGAEVAAKDFDQDPDFRRAILEAVPYLEFNPRKIKRYINAFRLQCFIADRRHLLNPRATAITLISKCVVMMTLWPEAVDKIVGVEDPSVPLQKASAHLDMARDYQKRIDSVEGLSEVRSTLEKFHSSIDDPTVRLLVKHPDLAKLLGSLPSEDVRQLSMYLRIGMTAV